MKNDFEYEFEFMVNNHHKFKKAQEFNIPEEYMDHEIRMEQLERKSRIEQKRVNHEAIKFGLMAAVSIPTFCILLRLMIAVCWAYSFAVRGF